MDQDLIQIVDEIAQQDTDCQAQCNPQKRMLLAQIKEKTYKRGVWLNCTGISRVLLNERPVEYSKQLFVEHPCKLATQTATEAPIILLFNSPPPHFQSKNFIGKGNQENFLKSSNAFHILIFPWKPSIPCVAQYVL